MKISVIYISHEVAGATNCCCVSSPTHITEWNTKFKCEYSENKDVLSPPAMFKSSLHSIYGPSIMKANKKYIFVKHRVKNIKPWKLHYTFNCEVRGTKRASNIFPKNMSRDGMLVGKEQSHILQIKPRKGACFPSCKLQIIEALRNWHHWNLPCSVGTHDLELVVQWSSSYFQLSLTQVGT